MNRLFAPVGTKTYVDSRPKYIIIIARCKKIQNRLYELENGDKRGKAIGRPDLFAFKIRGSSVRVLKFNRLNLAITARMLKEYPDEIMIFVGDNYWHYELPEEIRQYSNKKGNIRHIEKAIEQEEAALTCLRGS